MLPACLPAWLGGWVVEWVGGVATSLIIILLRRSHFHRLNQQKTHSRGLKDLEPQTLTNDADASGGLLRACGVHIEDAVVAVLVLRPHPLDGDVACVVVGRRELHLGILVADDQRHAWLVRQKGLVGLGVPAHLPDGVIFRQGDVAAERQGATCLCYQVGKGYDTS